MFQEHFKERYKESLGFYKHFYDDLWQYGSEKNPEKVFYFVPGLNGTPGQIRFALPSIIKRYGENIYIRCCHLKEFSALIPTWEKYTSDNIDKKRQIIIADLIELCSRHDHVVVLTSSTGFYDFVGAYDEIVKCVSLDKLTLLWSACAPDHFNDTVWGKLLYPLNGFTHNGYRWSAYPNNDLLKFINPETTTKFRWRYQSQKKTFFKIDLESRFVCFNVYWAYFSLDCFNVMLRHILKNVTKIMEIETHVLVASNDGFWQGRSKDEISEVIGKYVDPASVLIKDASHLWVAAPENLSELIDRLE